MAEHFTKEEWDRRVRAALERKQQQKIVGASRLSDPAQLRAALQRRNERREAELP